MKQKIKKVTLNRDLFLKTKPHLDLNEHFELMWQDFGGVTKSIIFLSFCVNHVSLLWPITLRYRCVRSSSFWPQRNVETQYFTHYSFNLQNCCRRHCCKQLLFVSFFLGTCKYSQLSRRFKMQCHWRYFCLIVEISLWKREEYWDEGRMLLEKGKTFWIFLRLWFAKCSGCFHIVLFWLLTLWLFSEAGIRAVK